MWHAGGPAVVCTESSSANAKVVLGDLVHQVENIDAAVTKTAPVATAKEILQEVQACIDQGSDMRLVVIKLADQPRAGPKRALADYDNPNRPSDYAWLSELLAPISQNTASKSVPVRRLEASDEMVPLFVVAGICPGRWAKMQAVMFAADAAGTDIDFWWIKPQKENKLALETATLNLHTSGDHRNAPDSSKALYQPFADMFKPGANNGDEVVRFGMATVDVSAALGQRESPCVRAYMDNKGQRMWIVMFWQEESEASMFSDRYIKGKIVYQRDPKLQIYFSRSYYLPESNGIWISEVEDQCWTGEPLPDDCIKDIADDVSPRK